MSLLASFRGWARARSLTYFNVAVTCCADEVVSVEGCRYDLSRFGCERATDHREADLLLVSGFMNDSAEKQLKKIYDEMALPRWVIAIGSCACSGGLFSDQGIGRMIPVDVFIPGCPPRPEALMNGLLILQEKIREDRTDARRDSAEHPLGQSAPGGEPPVG